MTLPDGPEGIADEAGGRPSTRGADPGVVGNERLTAVAGAVLMVPITVEIATMPALRAFMAAHIYIGVLIVGPLAVKLGSTGWRFLRYYIGTPAFVRRGPPAFGLRLLAPLLVATTVVLFGSGLGLLITGPARPCLFVGLHAISAVIWFPMIAIHVVAHIWRVPRLATDDFLGHPATAAVGRGLRIGSTSAPCWPAQAPPSWRSPRPRPGTTGSRWPASLRGNRSSSSAPLPRS